MENDTLKRFLSGLCIVSLLAVVSPQFIPVTALCTRDFRHHWGRAPGTFGSIP